MRSTSRVPVESNRQSSTLVAWAEKSAKFVPRPSHLAPSGKGKPSQTVVRAATVTLRLLLSTSVEQRSRTARSYPGKPASTRGSRSGPPSAQRVNGRELDDVVSRAAADLAENRTDMALDGAFADDQFVGDH